MKSNVPFAALLSALLVAGFVSTPTFADRDGDRDGYSDSDNDHSGYSDNDNDRDSRSSNDRRDRSGDRSGNSGYNNKTEIKARMYSSVQAGARGEVELKTTATRQKFSAEVKLPIPSLALNIPDATEASFASVTLFLIRGVDTYATCDLDLKAERYSSYSRKAEYKVELATYNGAAPIGRYGNCVDANGAVVIPAVQVGDTVAVDIDTYGEFLNGTFVLGR